MLRGYVLSRADFQFGGLTLAAWQFCQIACRDESRCWSTRCKSSHQSFGNCKSVPRPRCMPSTAVSMCNQRNITAGMSSELILARTLCNSCRCRGFTRVGASKAMCRCLEISDVNLTCNWFGEDLLVCPREEEKDRNSAAAWRIVPALGMLRYGRC